jgi:myosin V
MKKTINHNPLKSQVNPFKMIPDLYSLQNIHLYTSGKLEKKPHVYSTAAASFAGLCERDSSQTILISGESGAGKTETTKFVR